MSEVLSDYLEMTNEVHADNVNVGWWNNLDSDNLKSKINLVSSEVFEQYEGIRKGLPDAKLPHRAAEEVEISDVMIRLMDLLGFYTADAANPDNHYDYQFVVNYDSKHDWVHELNHESTILYRCIFRHRFTDGVVIDQIVKIMNMVVCYVNQYNLDLMGSTEEKLEFNRNRADHKLENRAKDGGKKF